MTGDPEVERIGWNSNELTFGELRSSVGRSMLSVTTASREQKYRLYIAENIVCYKQTQVITVINVHFQINIELSLSCE